MVGGARYIVGVSCPKTCEYAVAVADAWRGAHLARTVLERLTAQAAAGLRRMVADTVAANAAMIRLATRAGFTVRRKREDGRLLRLEKVLTADSRAPAIDGPSIGAHSRAA
jgi:RimJ/RimL family protein N-acetyltransferase